MIATYFLLSIKNTAGAGINKHIDEDFPRCPVLEYSTTSVITISSAVGYVVTGTVVSSEDKLYSLATIRIYEKSILG
jgi:hypothetical protein